MSFKEIKQQDLDNFSSWEKCVSFEKDVEKLKEDKMTIRDFIFIDEEDFPLVLKNLNFRTKSSLKQLWYYFNSPNVSFHKFQENCIIEIEPKIQNEMILQPKFDVSFSSPHFILSNNNQRVQFDRPSNNQYYADYHNYPVARIPYLFKKKFIVEFQMSAYGWFGVGSKNLLNDGFPGYTPEGFAICTDGRLYHNKSQLETSKLNSSNSKVTLTCDPSISLLEVVVGNEKYQYISKEIPKEVYFFISVSSNCSVELISLNE
jgi:hypothetical protein